MKSKRQKKSLSPGIQRLQNAFARAIVPPENPDAGLYVAIRQAYADLAEMTVTALICHHHDK